MPRRTHHNLFVRWLNTKPDLGATIDDIAYAAYSEGIRIERQRWQSKIRCPGCSAYNAENCPRCKGRGIVTRRRSSNDAGVKP